MPEQCAVLELSAGSLRAGMVVDGGVRVPPVELYSDDSGAFAIDGAQLTPFTRAPGWGVADWAALETAVRWALTRLNPYGALPPVLLVVPAHAPQTLMDRLYQFMFETILAPQACVVPRPMAAAAGAGASGAVVADVGARGEGTVVSLVWDTRVLETPHFVLDVDEGVCDDWLAGLLEAEGPAGSASADSRGRALRVVAALKAAGHLGSGRATPAAPAADDGILDVAKVVVEGKISDIVNKKQPTAATGDSVTVSDPDNSAETLTVGPVRHRYLDPLVAAASEAFPLLLAQVPDAEERATMAQTLVVIARGALSRSRQLGPTVAAAAAPAARAAHIPDYFPDFKDKPDLTVFLGAAILSRILLSDIKMFVSKYEYSSRGPAAYRLLEA